MRYGFSIGKALASSRRARCSGVNAMSNEPMFCSRSVAPTAAGERLLRSLDPALEEVARGLSALADWRGEPSGVVRLSTFGYAARTILAPKLPRFLLDHPEISVEVIVDDRLVDLVAGGFDAGIRLGETVERDMVAVPVGPDLRTVVVGTPGYFERYSRPLTPADLQQHRCVNYRLIGGGGLLPWEFEQNGQELKIGAGGQLIVNDEVLSASAVRAGAGLGYMQSQRCTGACRRCRPRCLVCRIFARPSSSAPLA